MFHNQLDIYCSNISGLLETNSQTINDIPAPFIAYDQFDIANSGPALGHGSFGEVRQAYYLPKKINVALKFQPEKDFQLEVKQLARFNHVNIVQLYGFTFDQLSSSYGIVMELMDGGSLHKIIKKNNTTAYTLAHALSWCLQCARGLEYLHTMKPKKVIHRDVKPLNLLLDRTGLRLKICDFGTTCDLHTMMSTQRGTFVYMAPEVFRGEAYDDKCDVYSWAVTFWQCLTRDEPFKKIENPFALMFSKANANLPLQILKRCPKKITEMIQVCTFYSREERSFEKRYSMTKVVSIMEELFQKCGEQPKPLRFNMSESSVQWKPDHYRSQSSGTIQPNIEKSYLEEHRNEVDAILKDFNAYFLLDDRYRPYTPDINDRESLDLFREHRQVSVKMLKLYLEYKNLETYHTELQKLKQQGCNSDIEVYINRMDENSTFKKLHKDYLDMLNKDSTPAVSALLDPSSNNAVRNRNNSFNNNEENGFVFVSHQDATLQ